MKSLIYGIIFLFLFMSCQKENKKDQSIINMLDSAEFCQKLGFENKNSIIIGNLRHKYQSMNYYCYNSLDLFEDSIFFMNFECESKSNITIGKWLIKEDTLIIKDLDIKHVDFIKRCKIKGNKNKKLVLHVKNYFNQPIEDFRIINFKKGVKAQISLKYGGIGTNKDGLIIIDKSQTDSIMITSFRNITNKQLIIKNENLPDTIFLKLFFLKTNFCYYPQYIYKDKNTIFSVKKNRIIEDVEKYELKNIP